MSEVSLRERLFSQLVINRETGCLLWTGRKDSDGYGCISVNNRDQFVHRVMYRLFVEEIPEGMELDHVKARGCANRHCASPAHLEAVTHAENMRRMNTATHCAAGHEWDLLNTRWLPNGRRNCRTCARARELRRPPRKKTS